jgi:hypothetical protein
LREVLKAQNLMNKTNYKNNSSGYPGVTWHKIIEMWQVRIGKANVRNHLGYFHDKEEAARVYAEAKSRMHSLQT